MTDKEAMQVFRFVVENDMADGLFFGTDKDGGIWVGVNCNDLFWWACADLEEITPDKLPLLKQCIDDRDAAYIDGTGEHQSGYGSIFAGTLYACRVRKMRPQTAWYTDFHKCFWPLVDAAGPEREADFGNPYTRERAEKDYEERQKEFRSCPTCHGLGRIKNEC